MITFIHILSYSNILIGFAGVYLAFNVENAFMPGSLSLASILFGLLCLEWSKKS